MSTSIHVVGFRKPDQSHILKVNAMKALEAAGAKVPDDLSEYFGHIRPELVTVDTGLEVEVPHVPWQAEMLDGFEVDLSKIPAGVSKLRFYVSY